MIILLIGLLYTNVIKLFEKGLEIQRSLLGEGRNVQRDED